MAVQEIITMLWYGFLTELPAFITATIIFLLGFIVGKVISRVSKEVLVRVRIDKFVEDRNLFKLKISDFGSLISKWVIYILFIQLGVAAIGSPELTAIVAAAVNFLLGAVGAVVIMLVGYIFAGFVKDQVVHSRTFYGDIVGNIIFFLIIYVSIALALPFLKMDPTLINWLLIVVMASIGLGLALAIGLGLKDFVAETAKAYSRKLKERKR